MDPTRFLPYSTAGEVTRSVDSLFRISVQELRNIEAGNVFSRIHTTTPRVPGSIQSVIHVRIYQREGSRNVWRDKYSVCKVLLSCYRVKAFLYATIGGIVASLF